MPGRTFVNDQMDYSTTNDYRYAFNGKEHDSDGEFGSLTHYDYGFRIYNPAIGKFLSVDPLTKDYAMLTPYQFASNSPIANIDLDGLEAKWFMYNIPTGQFKEIKPKMAGPVSESTINSMGYFSERQVKQYQNNLSQGQKPFNGPTIRATEYTDGSPNTLKAAKGLVQTTPMILEEVAEVPMLVVYGIKGVITGDYTDAKYQAAGIIIPGLSKTSINAIFEGVEYSSKMIIDAHGNEVTRYFVNSNEDLFKIVENASGGNLKNLNEVKPNFYEGIINGKRTKIEFNLDGHPHLNEGPHVKIQEFIEDAGKNGKGKWSKPEKIFLGDD